MADARIPNPLVERFFKGGIPLDLRMMAAQGALPLTPADLVELLHHLLRDPESEVRSTASATMMAMPVEALLPILKDRLTLQGVLDWALSSRQEDQLLEAVLQNPSTSDVAIEERAAHLSMELAELVVINQVRLLRRNTLLDAIESNSRLNNDQRRRLRELRENFNIGTTPAVAVAPSPIVAPVVPEAPPPLAPVESEVDEPAPSTEQEAFFRYLTEEERQEAQRLTTVQKVFRLNVAQKVILALKGTREERTVLVRDPNRIVSTAVLGSPRLTESEVEIIAGMRNVSDEVLRVIGQHKGWTKRYNVALQLVKNPRTPLAISIGMVARLNPRDMKSVSVDRNVSEVIRNHAQRFVREKATGKRG
ncbi:MAG: hypothetical protein JXO72_06830 [Vicinamibacteria bacterium]|nr:hypothetical protein [Vicinamibacteria bacterium]